MTTEKKRWELLRYSLPDTPLFKAVLHYVQTTPSNKLSQEIDDLQQARDGTGIEKPFVIVGDGGLYQAFAITEGT